MANEEKKKAKEVNNVNRNPINVEYVPRKREKKGH